jgi:hypothetical protein
MRNLRFISTTAAILLLGVGAVSAQSTKTNEVPTRAPVAQQNAPAEKMAPSAPEADKNASASDATKADANGNANEKSKGSAAKSGTGAASLSGKFADEMTPATNPTNRIQSMSLLL